MSVKPGKVKRHGFSVRFVHWTVTLSTFVLLFTGFGQMPVYRRYMVDRLPGLAWSSDFAVTLKLHYLAAAVLIFAVAYHITYHLIRRDFAILPRRGDLKESYLVIKAMLTGGEEPPSGKYLAEQRLAYAFIGANLLVLIITGIFKVLKNLPGVDFSPRFPLLDHRFPQLSHRIAPPRAARSLRRLHLQGQPQTPSRHVHRLRGPGLRPAPPPQVVRRAAPAGEDSRQPLRRRRRCFHPKS